jgi:hypothetical protein
MATWTNTTKNTGALSNQSFSNLTEWSASFITWAEAGMGWGALKADIYTNQTKNTSSLTNQTKN